MWGELQEWIRITGFVCFRLSSILICESLIFNLFCLLLFNWQLYYLYFCINEEASRVEKQTTSQITFDMFFGQCRPWMMLTWFSALEMCPIVFIQKERRRTKSFVSAWSWSRLRLGSETDVRISWKMLGFFARPGKTILARAVTKLLLFRGKNPSVCARFTYNIVLSTRTLFVSCGRF